ncbi:MAG: rhodanese-like domain-containing protein [ANME-2 cluster archaeon]|nr:rhodanese-like domain-containing protein [ANME-2 cluster archaeon]
MRTKIIIILLLSISVLGCLSVFTEDIEYTNVEVDEAKIMVDSGEYFLLDVRTQEEYDAGHIEGAVLIPYDELPDRLDEVPNDLPILVYCRTARRSAIASTTLTDNGYPDVYNMLGGIVDWEKKGYPIEK